MENLRTDNISAIIYLKFIKFLKLITRTSSSSIVSPIIGFSARQPSTFILLTSRLTVFSIALATIPKAASTAIEIILIVFGRDVLVDLHFTITVLQVGGDRLSSYHRPGLRFTSISSGNRIHNI
uniref:(northern house mosquito) hypothetical protein n=1 Tax=Culex pipiens TaxID=7175 RepID=A0A8D8A414_CULPI